MSIYFACLYVYKLQYTSVFLPLLPLFVLLIVNILCLFFYSRGRSHVSNVFSVAVGVSLTIN